MEEDNCMDAKKSNNNYGNAETQHGSGEPGFVFTEYDRGARTDEKTSHPHEQDNSETDNRRPQT